MSFTIVVSVMFKFLRIQLHLVLDCRIIRWLFVEPHLKDGEVSEGLRVDRLQHVSGLL